MLPGWFWFIITNKKLILIVSLCLKNTSTNIFFFISVGLYRVLPEVLIIVFFIFFCIFLQKDVMFRSTAGGQPLYSPAAASDSSGFSEHTGGAPGIFSPPGMTSFNPALRSQFAEPASGRSLSPQIPHTYHNPTLMASPYSTLPRKPINRSCFGSSSGGGPPPIMASSIGRNSPLLELTGVSSNRSSSLGRNR